MAVNITKKGGEAQSSLDKGQELTTVVTPVRKPTVKKQEANIIGSATLMQEDAFARDYFDPQKNAESEILRPPFNLFYMHQLSNTNNALGQLVSAMEVNIDGTGYVVELPDEVQDDEEDEIAKGIEDFFQEPFPGVSFITQRRKIRRDLEITGNAYLEILRSMTGDLIFLKHVEAASMRLLRLDNAVPVDKTVNRFGKEQTVTLMMRERRFAQSVGSKVVYFKEYGASRDLDKRNGKWVEQGEQLEFGLRATEIIHFTVTKDSLSPYGLPRWINQVPSVLGSRKAEELNLDFFNSGGLPPALVLVQGGSMTEEVRKQLQQYLSGKGASKHRAAIIETYSTAGSLESNAGSVRVTVERFGSERQQDSMFEKYDIRCEQRVRSSFRLPPLFVGKAEDYSFATAFASYSVAEAQVFTPEREEFDEIMNVTIMREINPDYVFRSLPLSVKDTAQQLEAIGMVAPQLDADTLVSAVNEVVNTNLKPKEGADDPPEPTESVVVAGAAGAPPPPIPGAAPSPGAPTNAVGVPVQRAVKMDAMQLINLAKDWAGYASGAIKYEQFDIDEMYLAIKSLTGTQRDLFDSYVAMDVFSGFDHDPEGAAELVGCATDIMNKSQHTGRCPSGQVWRNGRCVAKTTATKIALVGERTGPGGVNDHTHELLEGGVTSEEEGHTHTWAELDARTSEVNGHVHGLF